MDSKPDSMIVTLTVGQLRAVIREEISAAMQQAGQSAADKEWLRAEELASLYNLPKTWFEERGREGDIARAKPGRYVIFKKRDVEAYLEKNKTGGGNHGN